MIFDFANYFVFCSKENSKEGKIFGFFLLALLSYMPGQDVWWLKLLVVIKSFVVYNS